MASRLLLPLVALAFVGNVCSTALDQSPNLNELERRHNYKCHGQSCKIADLSGSSGEPYRAKKIPKDGTNRGDCCILRYNPSAKHRLYHQNPALKGTCHSKSLEFRNALEVPEQDDEEDEIEERGGCKPYIVIFAKGTDETGKLGNSVGPALKQQLDSAAPGMFSVKGVKWNNGQFGNYCLGLPGGAAAAAKLESVAAKCPDSKIVMSGYSQGAMVARNGIAYSDPHSHRHLRGIVTFGDPFRGAPIKNYGKPIIIYCHKGDRVCDGRDIIKPQHLTYADEDTGKAAQKIIKLVH